MDLLEVRELRYFVAVAEERNFTRAAERLGIAQPPLSRTISRMESRLGVRLLERSTRHVALTAAGEVLLDQARVALDAVTAAGRRAVRAGRTEPRLVVALGAGGDANLLPPILDAYRNGGDDLPAPEIVGAVDEPVAMLRDGRADVALLRAPFDGVGLGHQTLGHEAGLTGDAGEVAVVWPEACRSPAVTAFVRAAHDVAARAGSRDGPPATG